MSGTDGKNPNNVAGGYKATINNPNTSEEAKDHARDMLGDIEVDANPNGDYVDDGAADLGDDDAFEDEIIDSDDALDAPAASGKAKRGVAAAAKVSGKPAHGKETKNRSNVLGGYKATLKNPNVGEEAKKRAEDVLKAEGEM